MLTIKKFKTGFTPASSEDEVMQREGNIEQEPPDGEVPAAQDEKQRAHEQHTREQFIYEQRKRMRNTGVIRQY
ncbi:MAG: hypothetical protein IJ879_08765 [Muribaculaceae bacterium]|nr:hypothetical protein [Muribaculaceae bacterium]